MDERQIFLRADQALMDVIKQIKPDQWSLTRPDWLQVGPSQEKATLRQIIAYHAYDEAWVPDTLAGKTIEEVGDTYGKFGDDRLGDDPAATYAGLQAKAAAAVHDLTDLDKPVHLSYGTFPAREYLWHITTFRGLRSHDLARMIGADTTLPSELIAGLRQIIEPHAEEWRAIGIFGPAQAAPAGANDQARLLALVGRLPQD